MLDNMKDLVKFCEENIVPNKKRVMIREPSPHERDNGEVSPRQDSKLSGPKKSNLTTKNKASFMVKTENKIASKVNADIEIDPTQTLIDQAFQ